MSLRYCQGETRLGYYHSKAQIFSVFVKDVKFAPPQDNRDFDCVRCAMMRHVHKPYEGWEDRPKAETMKRKPTQRQLWMLWLTLALLALLPLLAVLQYHWLGQVSEGERERKKSVLTTMARQFCHDFDSELTEIYLRFKPATIPPISLDSKPDQFHGADDFTAEYRRWRETAEHPMLIKDVYRTRAGEKGETLSRYIVETGYFEPCEWPDSMSNLRKRLEAQRARDESLRAQVREAAKLKINIRDE